MKTTHIFSLSQRQHCPHGVFLMITVICIQFAFFATAVEEPILPYALNDQCNSSFNFNSNNTIPTSNMTALNISVAFLTSVSNNGGGKHYAGAFFLALERLNEIAINRSIPVRFNWTFRDAFNKESRAMAEMSNLYCTQNVSAFIGPDFYCKSASLLATGVNVPYITFNCQDNHNNVNAPEEHLIVNAKPSPVFVSRFIANLLHHYEWRSFWLVTGLTIPWQNMAKQLRVSVAGLNISINGETADEANDKFGCYYTNPNHYQKIVKASRYRTRVYVYLGVSDSLVLFVRALHEAGMTSSGEYVVVTADDGNNAHSTSVFYLYGIESTKYDMSDKEKLENLSAFKNVLMVKPLVPNINQKNFEDDVFNRNTLPPINSRRPPNSVPKRPNIPNEAYQLYDATMFYGEAVMALMAMPGANPENASQINDYLRCRLHTSIQGNTIWIHSNGESEKNYKVEGFTTDFTTLESFQEVGNFNFVGMKEPIYEPSKIYQVKWVLGRAPQSNPDCGFNGALCPSNESQPWKVPIIIVGVFSFVLFVVVILVLAIRHYMYEKKLEKLAWKIEREDIQILNAGQFNELTTPLRPRKKDSYSGNHLRSILLLQDSDPDIISDGSCASDDIPLGVYKGTNVAVRKVRLQRKHLELNRALKKQLQLRKELTHENINRFIGACIEIPYVYMVTQYCQRKSLQDILRNEDSPLDDMFSTSLVQDLIRGMSFIHDNEIGYHGNLKSSNCLVDSRWTLKITDFGLSALGTPDNSMFDDEESTKGQLWTAPELLHCRRRSSNSSSQPNHLYHGSQHSNSQHSNSYNNNNNNKNVITGSQKGDVYSFAIILYELYGKSGPWGATKLTSGQIIDSLQSRTTPVLRPDTSSLTCGVNVVNLIHACWDDDPELRPDFKYGIRHKFKPIQQGFLKSNIFDNMLAMMEKYANNLEAVVAERTEQLRQEKKLTENLLLRMLPRSVAEKLKRGLRVEAEQYEQVSIYFSDIVGFTELSAESTPMEVVDLLNDLYTCFDSIIEEFDVYKVETIGDAYMVVSGLPIRNDDRHAGEIASMSLLLLDAIRKKQFRIRGSTNNMLKIRIGIHSGSCCAGVVGLKMPRYCLFGDTVNTASRLESTGEALKIHCSGECKKILDKLGGYTLEERGYIEMKGKGSLLTYFLISEDQHQRYKRIYSYKRMGSDGRCVSSSNLDYTGKIYSISHKGLAHGNLLNARNPPISKDSPTNIRNSFNSLNTTMDSTCSEFNDEFPHHQMHTHQTTPSSQLDFISTTLPRASNPKYHNSQMSPIAEDPNSFGDRTLEKTVSFPESSLHENNTSENDALIEMGNVPLQNFQQNNTLNRHLLNNRPVLGKSSRTGVWRMESFDEDTHCPENQGCEVNVCDLVNPETVL